MTATAANARCHVCRAPVRAVIGWRNGGPATVGIEVRRYVPKLDAYRFRGFWYAAELFDVPRRARSRHEHQDFAAWTDGSEDLGFRLEFARLVPGQVDERRAARTVSMRRPDKMTIDPQVRPVMIQRRL